jgi:hypothetical protein
MKLNVTVALEPVLPDGGGLFDVADGEMAGLALMAAQASSAAFSSGA